MVNPTKPAGTPEGSKPGTIDLTDIVDGSVAGDFEEDILELTDIVNSNPSREIETEVIELTDIVNSKDTEQVEEEILELTEIVDGDSVEEQKSPDEGKDIEEFVEVDEDYIEVADEPYEEDEEIVVEEEPDEEEFEQVKPLAMELLMLTLITMVI